MKILFANGRPAYPFFIGGDGIMIHTLLLYLSNAGHNCISLGVSRIDGNFENPNLIQKLFTLYKWHFTPKLKLITTLNNNDFKKKLFHSINIKFSYNVGYPVITVPPSNLIHNFNQTISDINPDIIITQLDNSEDIIREAFFKNIPTILIVTDAEKENALRLKSANIYKCKLIVSLSKYLKKIFQKKTYIPIKVFYPPISPTDYYDQQYIDRKYITCINPVLIKGGAIFEKIIQRLPDTSFLCIKGWYDPLKDGFDFQKYPNVTVMNKQINMKKIYSITKILLIPSLWKEAFARVAIEAGICGIPVIASNRGGIPESVGKGGLIINNPYNIDHWVKTIELLNNDKVLYNKLSLASKKYSIRFSINKLGPKFENWLKNIIDS